MAYNEYSLPDTRTVLYHPDADAASLYRGDAAESPGQGFRPDRAPSCVSFAGNRHYGAMTKKGTADCGPLEFFLRLLIFA